MFRTLRPDHILIKELNGNVILHNKNFDSVKYPIKPIHAFMLSLYNGDRNDDEVNQIAKYIFDKEDREFDSFMQHFLYEYERFLIPVQKAEKIFEKPWPCYEPEFFLQNQSKDYASLSRLPAPKYLVLYLTNNCIRQCQYCYAKAKYANTIENDSISAEKMKNIIYEAFKLGVNKLLLTGGEPLLRSDIYEIIDYAANLNISVELLTKQLINKDILKSIDFSLVNLSLSIDSHIPYIANFITGSANFYEEMMKNINWLNSINIAYNVSIVITNLNKDSITDTIKYFIDNGANHIFTNHYECSDYFKINKKLFIDENEKLKIDEMLQVFLENAEFSNKVTHSPYNNRITDPINLKCSMGHSRISIRFDGKYIFCEKLANVDDIDLGNISDKSILEVWNSEELLKYINPKRELFKTTKCYDCNEFDDCHGKTSCIYNSKNQYGSYFRPIKEVEYACSKR